MRTLLPPLENSSPVAATFVLPVIFHSVLSLGPEPSCEVTPLLGGDTCGAFWLSVVPAVLWEAQGAQAVLLGLVCHCCTHCPHSKHPPSLQRGTHPLAFAPCPGEQQLCPHSKVLYTVVHMYLIFVFISGGTILRFPAPDRPSSCLFSFYCSKQCSLLQRCSPCEKPFSLGAFLRAWGEGAGLPGCSA